MGSMQKMEDKKLGNSKRRFVLNEDKRSIMDTETNKMAVFEKSVLSEDIADYCSYLNLGTITTDKLKWK